MLSLLRQQQFKSWRRHSSSLTRSLSTQQVPNSSSSSGAHPSSADYKKSLNFNFNFIRNNYNSNNNNNNNNNNTSSNSSNDNRGFIQSLQSQSLSPASSSSVSTSTERDTNTINDRYIDFTHQSLLYRLERENFNGKLEKYIPPELRNHEHTKRQIDLEEIQELRGSTELDKMRQNLNLLGKGSTVRRVHEEMIDWFHPLKKSLEKEITDITNLVHAKDRSRYGPFLLLIPPEKLAIITLDATVSLFLRTGNRPVTTNFLATYLGDLIEKEVNLTRLKQTKDQSHQWINRLIKEKPQVALRLYNKMKTILQDKDQWSSDMKLKLGAFLLKVLSNDILNEHGDPVFRFYYVPLLKRTGTKFQGCFEMEKLSFERINKTSDGNFITNIRYLPMLLPPCKWDNRDYYGSYLLLKPPIMKHVSRAQVQAVQKAKMNEVNIGLDYLGSIPWRINTSLYDIINQCIEKNLIIGEIPSYQNLNIPTLDEYMASLPSELKATSSQDYLTNSYRYHRRRILQKNSELHSLRCDLSLKLSVAKEFLNDTIYFPHNLDFRGRAYPIPPNLNHIGSDLSRSLLLFHTKKPLGVNGLKWLKIHLCNLFGNNKISFDKREEYINKHIHDVYESAKTPFEGKMWWSTAEKPFQALATCMEIVKAIESGDHVNFESNFPVHQDGSCNGLQHYAGLGKDKDGGIAVNLVDGDIPSDVYTRVLDIVHKVMDEDSKIDVNEEDSLKRKKGEIARAIKGFVNRKTIKQTVMTSVYGVTFIGARSQVQARLEEAWLKDKFGVEGTEGPKMISQQDEEFLYEAAGYLGRLTLKSLEEMFHSARGIMDWLADVSKRISMEGQVMSWITPLGLPVMQPYREESHYMVKTALQSILVTRDDETLPVSKRKQRTAFPPNFVHSLDATHMMMTCLKMKNGHKTFAAVHDSYWTHPCDVEFMNKALRECFVELYSKPILEDLKASLERRYPGVELGEIPERGQLDLEEVKKSKFFFH